MSSFDWKLAARRAAQLAPAGRAGSPSQLRGVVASLHRAAEAAPPIVARITGLHVAARIAAARPAYVVDRARWAEANAQMFHRLMAGSLPLAGPGKARYAAEQVGIMLAYLSSRVLGQFDPYHGSGRLFLVAPNVMALERELDLDVMDFRLWVALHEQTHAVQFTAAPWLTSHLKASIGRLMSAMVESDQAGKRLREVGRALVNVARGRERSSEVYRALLKPEGAAELDHVIGVMSLLEGHAEVVMDEVGPSRIPSVRRIRATFERRRDGVGVLDTLVRRLSGIEDKRAQYSDGASFVRTVVAHVGHQGLNRVWERAGNLPTRAEIAEPERWVARVAR